MNAKRRLDRISVLRSIDQAITGNMDLNLTLNFVISQIIQELEVDAADILLYEPNLQQLQFISGHGFRTQIFQYTKLRLGEGCAGKVALDRQMLHLPDLREPGHNFAISPHYHEEGFIEYYGVPLVSKGKVIGVLEIFNRKQIKEDSEWTAFLHTLAGQAAVAIDNINLFSQLQQTNVELVHAYDTTIEGWARALELRDMETKDHSSRVVNLTMQLVRVMGFDEKEQSQIRRGALLHDIGKIGVPDHILQKPGPLTDDEWMIMKQHPVYAYDLISPIQYLRPSLDIPYSHHEKWDGSGYPRGLVGEQIPLAARIFAIVDVWDALLSDRPYRPAWPKHEVIKYIKNQAGTHFDPQVVEQFLKIIERE